MGDPTPAGKAGERVINEAALIQLVQEAMASGVVTYVERLRDGEITSTTNWVEAFGDQPADFVRYRRSLVDALTADSPGAVS